MSDTEEDVEEEDDVLASSRGPTHAWHQHAPGFSFVIHPPRIRAAAHYEDNPRAQRVTNYVERNNDVRDSTRHTRYAGQVYQSILDEDGGTLQPFQSTHPSIARFRINGGLEHYPVQETGGLCNIEARPELGDQGDIVIEPPSLLLRNLDMSSYDGRFETYSLLEWRHDFMSAEVLAEAGFYYTGVNDEVICSGCGGTLNGWQRGDDPLVEHLKNFDNECPNVQQ